MARVVQSLWIGDRLSVMEQLCISSFLRHGHVFHLYVYQQTEGIPAGTVVLDGNQAASRIFTYREHKTYAGSPTSSATNCSSKKGAGLSTPTPSA
jgi:hypothetical protein